MKLDTEVIAEKFIQYYWRQTLPYAGRGKARVLQQNIGKQAAIINRICRARTIHNVLSALTKDPATWRRLVQKVAGVVRVMPLWKLQTVGQERLDFLYENSGRGRVIELRLGVAYCFRKFHALITDLVRGPWVRYVRQQNLDVLGETADLNEFLFGSERNCLDAVRPVLLDLQGGHCFYCNGAITGATAHVDHFISWSRYPVDLAHNFVLADNAATTRSATGCRPVSIWLRGRSGRQSMDRNWGLN